MFWYDDMDNKLYPMPLVTSDQDLVYVGRIRKDLVFDNAITLWCCGDQVRKGAATPVAVDEIHLRRRGAGAVVNCRAVQQGAEVGGEGGEFGCDESSGHGGLLCVEFSVNNSLFLRGSA